MAKQRILILGNSASGLYDFRNELLLSFLKQYEVYVSLPDGDTIPELAKEGCHVIHTPVDRRGMNPRRDMKLFMAYLKLIKDIRPDVVLTYTIKPNIYGALACRVKKVPYMVNITGLGSAFEHGGMVQKLVVFLYRIALKQAGCVFFQNQYNQSVFEGFGIHGRKSRLLPGSGVNLERHPYEAYPENEIPVCLFVGRIMKEKGIEEFLYAAQRFHEQKKQVRFLIIGKYEEDYEKVIRPMEERGIVEVLPYQKVIHPYYAAADVIVVPSYHEGMSNVILEASATGRPVLASAIPGCQEGFSEGVSGFGFAPRDREAFYQALDQFFSLSVEERAGMGKAARKKMEREFDRQHIVAIYHEELQTQNSVLIEN